MIPEAVDSGVTPAMRSRVMVLEELFALAAGRTPFSNLRHRPSSPIRSSPADSDLQKSFEFWLKKFISKRSTSDDFRVSSDQ
jgi:hypothetical protein